MNKYIFFLLSLLIPCHGNGQGRDTFEVYFPFGKAAISLEAQAYIDRLVFNDTLIHGDKLMLLGFTDYVGGKESNDSLSKARARNIQSYLGAMGFDKNDISLCVGKGKIERNDPQGKNGFAQDRKVQIIICHVRRQEVFHPLPLAALRPVKIISKNKVTPVVKRAVPETPRGRIEIANLQVNQTFALHNIFFEPGSPLLLPESSGDLQLLLFMLTDHPEVHIRIEGHVCCLGTEEGLDVQNLSYYRAMTVYNYLIDNGIDKERLSALGLGNRNPIVKSEVTEEDRIRNRRVEIRILKK